MAGKPSRKAAVALAAVACAALLGPATAAAKPDCDKRKGTTLGASKVLRFYGVWKTASKRDPARGLFACTYKDGRRYRLSEGASSGGPTQFGVRDSVLYFVDYAKQTETSAQDAGLVYVTTAVWDGRKREFLGLVPSTSVRYSDMTISPSGVLAAIAEPYGRQPIDGGGNVIAATSQVVLYDPLGYRPPSRAKDAFYPPWRTLASGDPGSMTDLAANAATLYWQDAGAITSVPFRYVPAATTT